MLKQMLINKTKEQKEEKEEKEEEEKIIYK